MCAGFCFVEYSSGVYVFDVLMGILSAGVYIFIISTCYLDPYSNYKCNKHNL